MSDSQPRVVVIGGGTGSFTVLQALKAHSRNITALVNMADDGGSTGLLRDELGVLPPGDIRQCLVALSDASLELRELFNYRFPGDSSLGGHSFGNLFLSAVEKMTDDFNDAVRIAGDVLRIRGRVLPITLIDCQLVMEAEGRTTTGQYAVETSNIKSTTLPKLSLSPKAALNPVAREAIAEADIIVIAPGNLYASLAPALLVEGLPEALKKRKAPLVYVANLVNKPNHTSEYGVHDYANEIERFIGGEHLDYVLYNIDTPTTDLLNLYALDGEHPTAIDKKLLMSTHYKAIPGHFLSHGVYKQNMNDTRIKRSLIRHDGAAVAAELMKIVAK
jgi:uncharacterized cofD-like protein